MGTYTTSTGEKYNQSQIDRKIRQAKKKKIDDFVYENGFLFCEDCKTTVGRFDCSHQLSVDKCKKLGQFEKAWNVDNIKIRCRTCHQRKDKLNIHKPKIK